MASRAFPRLALRHEEFFMLPILGRRGVLALLAFVVLHSTAPARAAESAKVYVLLWFDTEDYVLPASDDAALKVAQFLTKEGVKATFKVVGEKARTLGKRKRTDV